MKLTHFTLGNAVILLAAAFAHSQQMIKVRVDATHTPQKLLHVEETLPVSSGPLTLYYPKWIPGDHGPAGPVSNLTGLKFETGGKAVPWNRDLLDLWTFHVDVPVGSSELHASFDYIEGAGESSTNKLLVLEWNEVLLYPAGKPSNQLTFQAGLALPSGWKFGTSQHVAEESGNKVTFEPISLEMLVDSPVIAGQYYRVVDITPAGEPIHHEIDIAADSEEALNISPAVQKGMTNVVAESGKLFGQRHYREYHFLLGLSDHVAHYGLEHHQSNDSRLPERALLESSAGFIVGGLLPHEFVHSWNGKFRRPADLATPDYEKPMQDDLLWVYEGLTDYLGPMLAARSGLWTVEQYHDYLASIGAALGPGRPGRTWRPLQDTTQGEIGIRPPQGWMNWVRGTDYYDEGDLIWLEAATIIHQVTNGQKSIDDFEHVFHGMLNNGPEVKGYTFDQVMQALTSVAPYNWSAFFRKRLDSVAPEGPLGGIENGGWKLVFNPDPMVLPGRRGNAGDTYSLGFNVGEDGTIGETIVGGPAFKSGVGPGMKLAGVNGHVYTPDVLQDAVKSQKDVTLLVINDDYFETFKVDYTGGPRYPHLVRDDARPDYLDELIRAHVGGI